MSKYFTPNELACECGCGAMPSIELQHFADRVREEWGGPLLCMSGARCKAHVTALRGKGVPAAWGSDHNTFGGSTGTAIDLRPLHIEDMRDFHKFCAARLEKWDACMEDPAYTSHWAHLSITPRGRKRIFIP